MYKWKNATYLFLPLLASIVLLSSFIQRNERVKGNGETKEESRQATSFRKISSSGAFEVFIQQGGTHSIRVEAESNLLPYILTEVEGNKLNVHVKRGYNIQPTKKVNIYITLQELESLTSSGAGGFYSKGTLKTDNLDLGISGATNADLDLQAKDLDVTVSGVSHLKLRGNVAEASYRVSGSADISAFDLQTEEVKVGISGTAKANVNAVKNLNVQVSGMGTIKYKGSPSINQSVSGMGRISKEG